MMAPGAQPSRWNIPYQRNPFFTGREETLKQLHQALHTDTIVALSHPQGISGLGGIGKTQTALEYAYRYRGDYDVVLWVRADSTTALTSSFVDLASLLELPERDGQDQPKIVEAVLRWLRLHTGWLLVFDSMDDLAAAEPFVPKAGPGHILFTTRSHALGGIAQRLEVQKMEPETGALLLLRRATILPLQAALDRATRDDRSVARTIAQELDGLPLAIDQAGAYVKETPCTLMDYVELYRTRRRSLLEARGSFDKDYPASVATTWSLSFEKVSQANAAAAELLDFCAFLAPDAIPEEIIVEGALHLTSSLQSAAVDPLQFNQAIAVLLGYSLVGRNEDATLSIHRLVQAVLQDTLEETERRSWAVRAMLSISTAFPKAEKYEYGTWPQYERLLPHALLTARYIETDHIIGEEAGHLLNETASYLQSRARYAEAKPLYLRALAIREQQLGPEHPQVASVLTGLANLYSDQGKYAEAEPLYLRALHIREQSLGPQHPETAEIMHDLAQLREAQGNSEEARNLYARTLTIREQALGAHHPKTTETRNRLIALLQAMGRYEEAAQFEVVQTEQGASKEE